MSRQPAHGDVGDRAEALLAHASRLRRQLSGDFRDQLVEGIYADAQRISARCVRQTERRGRDWDATMDRLITSPRLGLALMLLLLVVVFWITIAGANVPSAMLASGLFWIEAQGSGLFESIGAPDWLTGFIWHGVYRALAWVIAVMLPPMAIFFPLFTILEDLGYLPRVAFNLDRLFARAGAHGKQVLTMCMGFGCNAAGVIACRTIDSPRERLIAILTNNFVPCNGRWPTLIMLATVFIAAGFSSGLSSLIAALSLAAIVILGVITTLIVSALLSRTVLQGEPSAFTLELPPYRRPDIPKILYTSLIDRTIFVLGRAVVCAIPAGGVIWLLANIDVGSASLAHHIAAGLDPIGRSIGLDGVILLAYIIAIPANEIVVPTVIMLYLGGSMMTEDLNDNELYRLFQIENRWTMLTAVNLMVFSLLHNPCATTIYTIWKETKRLRWTVIAAVGPLAIAFATCFLIAQTARLLSLVD
jgi:ferrous iron transport protein B